MSSKKKTETQQTNTYGYQPGAQSADIDALRNQINSSYNQSDPGIAYSFNNQRKNLQNRFDNPFGANYSPEAADAAKYAGTNDLDQAQGAAYQMDAFNRKNQKVAALGGLASQTAPVLTQTGGSGTTTQTTPFNWGGILNAGSSIGSAALL